MVSKNWRCQSLSIISEKPRAKNNVEPSNPPVSERIGKRIVKIRSDQTEIKNEAQGECEQKNKMFFCFREKQHKSYAGYKRYGIP